MVAWYVVVSKFILKFEPWGLIKAQWLANFMIELPPKSSCSSGGELCMLYVDGECNQKDSEAWIMLMGPEDISLEQSLRFNFKTSNNQVEYEALIMGLKLVNDIKVKKVKCKSDGKLATSHVNGEFQVKDPRCRDTIIRQWN